ncbi:MAG: sodium:solute symporter [Gammaproteobacteria bacterium]|nr:sodium:solute symporter [Gammaproteobacteria bacterium]
MQGLDIAVLIIYILAVTAFGAWFYRRADTPEGFTAAGSRLPGWAVGLSIFGTYLSSISFLALPGKAYASNWLAFVFSLSLPLAAWAAGKWFVPLYRASGDVSAYAYLERRFGLWARMYAMTFYLLTQLARMGTIMFLIALALESLTGWDIKTIIVVSGILITFYTVVGGIEAVIWTDVIQSIVLTLGAMACVAVLLLGDPGAAALFSKAAEADKFSLGSFAPVFTEATVWVVLLYGIVINLQNFGVDQSYIQRYQTARSLEDARCSVWIGVLVYIPVGLMFLLIGSLLWAYYQLSPELLPEALQAAGSGDRVFPHFIVTQLPAGITGLLIAALAAAAMSSVDTSINSSSTILMTDVYRRLVNPGASDKQAMRFLRLATVGLGVLGTATALLMISIKSALDVWWHLAGIFSGGMLGLFLLGAFSRRAAGAQALAAMVAGFAVIVWATFSSKVDAAWANSLHSFMTTVIATVAIFGVGILLSRGRERRGVSKPAETIYDIEQ